MEAKLTFFSPSEDARLYYEWWMPAHPKALLVIVHGLGDHSGRYGSLIRYFGERGYGLAIYDQRGHGHSEGRRGHFGHFQDLLGDLAAFVQMVRDAHPGVPVFLIGHSFGGQVAVNFVVRYSKGLRGLILSSPNIQLAMKISKWKKLASRYCHRWFPQMTVGQAIDPAALSSDPDVVQRYRDDPLVVRRFTLQAGEEIMRNQDIVMALASRIHLPVFFMHAGADSLCDPDGTRKFYRRIPVARKQLKIYDGFSHELFNEVRRDEVFSDMENWITELLQEEKGVGVVRRPQPRVTTPAGIVTEREEWGTSHIA